jgi:hypothetical protein
MAGEPVTSVTHSGSGKDADLVIEFVNGKRMKMGVVVSGGFDHRVRVWDLRTGDQLNRRYPWWQR